MKELIRTAIRAAGYIFHRNRKSKVIYYHDLGTEFTDMGTDFEQFKHHINQIRSFGFNIVDNIIKPKNEVMVCFDDGWLGIYKYRDYFIEQGFFPTIFLAIELIGAEGFLSLQQILEMQQLGFHFQCHTWTHTGLPDHNDSDLIHELKDSKEYLEKILGKPVDDICFPQGRFNQDVIEHCQKLGYRRLYSSLNGGYNQLLKQGLICRNLLQDVPSRDIKYVLLGDSIIQRFRLRCLHTK